MPTLKVKKIEKCEIYMKSESIICEFKNNDHKTVRCEILCQKSFTVLFN